MELWSIQGKVEGIMLRAARHWGTESSVVNDPLGEAGCTPLYAVLPSACGPVNSDLMFFPTCRRAPFWGLWQTYMNK